MQGATPSLAQTASICGPAAGAEAHSQALLALGVSPQMVRSVEPAVLAEQVGAQVNLVVLANSGGRGALQKQVEAAEADLPASRICLGHLCLEATAQLQRSPKAVREEVLRAAVRAAQEREVAVPVLMEG